MSREAATHPIPVEIAGCGYTGRGGAVKDPAAPAADAVAVWVPVEPVGLAYAFVVRRPGGGGALHEVAKCCCAAECAVTASRDSDVPSGRRWRRWQRGQSARREAKFAERAERLPRKFNFFCQKGFVPSLNHAPVGVAGRLCAREVEQELRLITPRTSIVYQRRRA